METTAKRKGQIVIPVEVRRRLGLKQGTRIAIWVNEKDNTIVLKPVTRQFIEGSRGIDRGKGLLQALAGDRKLERDKEERELGTQKTKVKR